MTTLFISDLHLSADREDITAQFLDFLEHEARSAQALYILGDLFEAWLGDDAGNAFTTRIEQALARTAAAGVACYFIHGNRDFLIGNAFARRSGVQLLAEETVAEIHGTPVLLMHGDSLCSDDKAHQRFRRTVRNPLIRRLLLALPLGYRRKLGQQMRTRSMEANARKPAAIMDVNQQTVEQRLHAHGVRVLLHGHTHRPQVHHFRDAAGDATRIVLGDWFEQGSWLRWDDDGFALHSVRR